MKTKTETCTGTLHRDPEGRWYAATQLTGKAYLDAKLQDRPDPNLAADAGHPGRRRPDLDRHGLPLPVTCSV